MRKYKENRGGAAVEFAIVLPLLLVLIFATIEFGLLLYNKAVITNASREGARQAIVYDANLNDSGKISKAISVARNYYLSNVVTFDPTYVPPYPTATINSGTGELTVTVNYVYQFLVLPNLQYGEGVPGGGIPLTAVTVMRLEK